MIVAIHNKSGQKITDVKVNEQNKKIDAVQWGGNLFLWDEEKEHYRECLVVPAIVQKNNQKAEVKNG